MQMNFNPVQAAPVQLPHPWPLLEQQGFHVNLLERAQRFKLLAQRDGFAEQGDGILSWVGEGFSHRFNRDQFQPSIDDAHREFKLKYLDAMDALATEFGDRVSSVVWETFAFLGTRPNPHETATIPSQQQYLTMHFGLADAVLHSLPDAFGLMLHVQSRIFERTGVVVEHNCDCSCSAQAVSQGAIVRCFLKPERFVEATNALLTHLLVNAKIIMVDGYPFNFGLSPEFQDVQAMVVR